MKPAMQIEKTEMIRLQDYFGDGFRSLAVWGASGDAGHSGASLFSCPFPPGTD